MRRSLVCADVRPWPRSAAGARAVSPSIAMPHSPLPISARRPHSPGRQGTAAIVVAHSMDRQVTPHRHIQAWQALHIATQLLAHLRAALAGLCLLVWGVAGVATLEPLRQPEPMRYQVGEPRKARDHKCREPMIASITHSPFPILHRSMETITAIRMVARKAALSRARRLRWRARWRGVRVVRLMCAT